MIEDEWVSSTKGCAKVSIACFASTNMGFVAFPVT